MIILNGLSLGKCPDAVADLSNGKGERTIASLNVRATTLRNSERSRQIPKGLQQRVAVIDRQPLNVV